jgi:hypothetical protein
MSYFWKLLSQQSGMSLVEMTIAGALAGGAAMGVASLMKNMTGSSKKAEIVIERTEFGSALGVFLNSAKGCYSLQNGTIIPTSTINYQTGDWGFNGVANIQTNSDLKYNNVKSFTAERMNIPDVLPITVKDDSGTKTLQKALIKFKLAVTQKSILLDPAAKRAEEDHFAVTKFEYNVPVMVNNSTGKIEVCGDNSTMAEACFALKGIYDETEEKCELPKTCESFGSFAVVNCTPKYASVSCEDYSRGTPYNNPVTGSKTCPSGSMAISTGGQAWYKDVDCGKKCTARINFSIGYYSCLKCD